MVQRYKLRLSDGTVLLVDHDGLSTWLVDGKAKVQLVGSSQWRPLKEFLAQERRAARRAERERASPEALPLVYPEPKEEKEVDSSSIGVPEGIQAFADDPALPDTASAPGPSTTDEVAPVGLPEVVVEDDDSPVTTEPPSPDPRPGEPAGVTALADDPLTPAGASVPAPPTPDEVAPVSVPPAPFEDMGPRVRVGTPRVVSEPRPGEPAGVTALADEPVAPAVPSVPVSPTPDGAPVRLTPPPVEDESPRAPVTPSVVEPEPTPIGVPEGVQTLAEEPVVPDGGPATPPATPEGRFASPDDFWPAPAERTGTPLASPAVIPLKPIDDRDERPRRAARAYRPEDEGDDLAERMLRPGGLGETLFHALSRFGTFLSRLLEPIGRLERGMPLLPPDRPEPRRPADTAGGISPGPPPAGGRTEIGVLADEVSDPAAADGLPIIRLKPLDDERAPRPIVPKIRRLRAGASAWIRSLTARVGRLARRVGPTSSLPSEGPTPSSLGNEPAPSRVAEPTPRPPLAAPPPIADLPTLRLAESHEPAEVDDIYEGPEDYDGVSVLQVAWLWTRRLAVIAVLVAGGIVAARSWESWFPKAGQLGNTMFEEVDRRVRSLDISERQQQAVEAAVEELPHLAPETIRLVMSSSPAGVLDPPEVFGVACDATDRGASTLTSAEVQELSALRDELLDTLRPSERQRVREYDRARAREIVFPYEHRLVLALFARGARALPPESRERLQALSGKAIAAGLAVPFDADPPRAER